MPVDVDVQLRRLARLTGLPSLGPVGDAAPSLPDQLAAQRVAITGQMQAPPAGPGWRMSNYTSASRLDALELQVAMLTQAVAALLAQLQAQGQQNDVLAAKLQLVQAAAAATQSQLDANTAADVLLQARTLALETQETADKLADAAVLAYQQQNDARVALLEARATRDEAAIAAAQATATTAATSASIAITNAATAQATATAAKSAADVAQVTASTAASQASTNATALTAVQADVATRLPAAMVQRFTITTPAVTLTVGVVATFPVTLPKAFADNQYLVFFTKASGGTLLNVQLGDTAKTAAAFTATMQTTGAVTVTVAASSAEVLAFHL